MATSLLEAFERQARGCRLLGATFTAGLADTLGAELRRGGGPLASLLPSWPGDAWRDAVPVRLFAAIHARVLAGDARLAALYPPHATQVDGPALIAALNEALATHRPQFEAMLAHPPQTNEIGRGSTLLGGYSEIARRTALPLSVLEIGASAGLNLRWDRYRYELDQAQWGDPASPVRIVAPWRGKAPALLPHIAVGERAGCDIAPIDITSPEQCLRLQSYVWPEQRERLERLQAALALARDDGLRVERSDAAEWVERQLAEPRAGRATVLVHSVVWQYLPAPTRERIRAAIDAAGRRATREAPFAWLAFEFEAVEAPATLRLTLWPGGASQALAHAHPHGAHTEWLGS
ncbi:MAG: DUF2332 domain-containing protein [Rhizobacter sp.]